MQVKFCVIMLLAGGLLVSFSAIPASSGTSQENLRIEIPGGVKLLSNVLGINNPAGRDFIWILTNYLCRDMPILSKVESENKRVPLLLYLDYIEKAIKLMHYNQNDYSIDLSIRNKDEKEKTDKFLKIFGYQLLSGNSGYTMVSNEDKNNWQKHFTFELLGYSPDNLANTLNKSEVVHYSIPVDTISVPFAESLITRIIPNEKEIAKNFIKIVAENFNFSFLLLTLYNLDEETINAIELSNKNEKLSGFRVLLNSSDTAGWELYKISLYLKANSLTLATPVDRELIKGAAGFHFSESGFIKNWMHNGDGKFGYFMRGLSEFDSKVKSIIFNIDKKKLKKELNLLYINLPFPDKEKISHLYDLKELNEFPEAMRIIQSRGNELYFPGDYRSWIIAAQNESMPETLDQLSSAVNIAPPAMDYIEYLKLLSKFQAEAGGHHYSGYNVFFKLYTFFSRKPELATPRNIVMLFRAYPRYPAIMAYLENIAFSDPDLVHKLILKISELEKVNNDSYETTMRIFQANLSLFWLLSSNHSVPVHEMDRIINSFLDIPLDKKLGYQFYYLHWFHNTLMKAINCTGPELSACILDVVTRHIPQLKMELLNATYLYNPRDREKERISLILNEQKIPPPEFIVNAYVSLTGMLSSGSATPLQKAILTMKESLKNPVNSPQHAVDAEIMNVFSNFDQLLLNNITNRDEHSTRIMTSLNNLIGYYVLGLFYSYWMNNPESPAYNDNQFIIKHDFSKLVTTILIRSAWQNSHLVFQDPEKGIYVESSLSTLPLELTPLIAQTEASAPQSRIMNSELSKWLWASAVYPDWDSVDDETNEAIAFIYFLGTDIVSMIQEQHTPALPSTNEKDIKSWLSFVGKPRAIIIDKCFAKKNISELYQCNNIVYYFTPSEIFYIGKYAIDNKIKIQSIYYESIIALLSKNPYLFTKIDQFGALAPHISGNGNLSMEILPPYESLERYYTHSPISERLFDFKITIAVFVHKLKYPAILQYNMWQKAVLYILSHARQNYYDDWEPITAQAMQINEEAIQRWIQELKAQGYLELE